MASFGFTYYDEIPVPIVPSIQDLIDNLSGAQKTAILDGFTKKILPKTLSYNVAGLDIQVIRRLYEAIDSIEELARILMRGELVVTPAVIDPGTGEEITPAVYNTPPANATALVSDLQSQFTDVFTTPQLTAVVNRMVQYSKHDGSGDWAFYSSNVIV